MLASIRSFSRILYRTRWLLWAALAAAAVALAIAVLSGADSQGSVLIALVGLLWASFLLALAHAFPQDTVVERRPARFWTRLGWRLQRAWHWFLAITTVVLGAALAWLTLRAVGIALG